MFSCALFTYLLTFPALATSAGLKDDPIAGSALQYLDSSDWILTNGSLSISATVPGDLLTDLERAGIIQDPIASANLRDAAIAALMLNTWSWSTTFDLDSEFLQESTGSPVLLVLDSVKLAADIALNGVSLLSVADQFLRYNVTVPEGLLQPTGNVIVVSSPPFSDPRNAAGRFQGCAAGWDWAPQSAWGPMTRGIVKSVYLVAAPTVALAYVSPLVFYNGSYPTSPLNDSTAGPWTVSVRVHARNARASGPPVTGVLVVSGGWPGALPASTAVSIPAGVESVISLFLSAQPGAAALWWPAGLGSQSLYSVNVAFTPGAVNGTAGVPVTASRRIGFRVFTLVTDDDSDPAALAGLEGSGNLTMRFKVNGADVWSRGANMIPMEMLDGRSSASALEALVQSAVDGRMNTLRVWGGGIFLHDAFFDAADAKGLLLYHDMMYAQQGHVPAASPTQDAELRHQIRRLSAHPSVAVWDACNECDGQGLFASFVMTTVVEEDPSRPPWPSCPSSGWQAGVDRLWSLPSGAPLVPRSSVAVSALPRSESPMSAGSPDGGSGAGGNCTYLYNIDIDHGSLGPSPPAATPSDCCALCNANATCWSATWYQGSCWMKGPSNNTSLFGGAVSCWPSGHPLPPMPSPGPNPSAPPLPRNGHVETHGPYIEGSGFDTVDTSQPLTPHSPGTPPSLEWVATGTTFPGVFASEFGCSLFSSFESTIGSITDSANDWQVHGPSWYWRDWPCDSGIVSYFGPQNFSVASSATTLQRQLYLCMTAQALEMKGNIETRRSSNAWGTVIWQLNEVWPTGGWGSLEYGTVGFTPGQVEGGRWKPLHYMLSDFLFHDVGVACGVGGACYVKNDGPLAPVVGALQTSLLRLQGAEMGTVVPVASVPVSLPAGGGVIQWVCVDGSPLPCTGYGSALQTAGCAADGSDCILLLDVVSNSTGVVVVSSHELLAAPAALVLPNSAVTATVTACGAGAAILGCISISASAPALYVFLSSAAQGRFSNNALMLQGGRAAGVNFTFLGEPDVPLLASTLRIEHVQMYM